MFHSSPQHHFDTMFVILCVIAGASSHSNSNSSRSTPTHLLNHPHALSFIDLLINASPSIRSQEPFLKSNHSSKPSDGAELPYLIDLLPSNDNNLRQPTNVCALLANFLTGSQLKFCTRHQEILEQVIPDIIKLTKQECTKITRDLRWNCTTIRPFLDRSSTLAFTREAALIRSLMNASMMYLILKICADHNHHSCGCVSYRDQVKPFGSPSDAQTYPDLNNLEMLEIVGDNASLNSNKISRVDPGSTVRFSLIKRRGCHLNSAFAAAITGALFDADDSQSLNKAYKILNGEYDGNRGKNKRRLDIDRKEISLIKWTKSAVNLHNNNVGRQIVRMAIRQTCRCHGISGACQLQTCWDEIDTFSDIALNLRAIYLRHSYLVSNKNLGSLERPDVYLAKTPDVSSVPRCEAERETHRVASNEIAYLYESPEYCVNQPKIEHYGTKGRECILRSSTSQADFNETRAEVQSTGNNQPRKIQPGSCDYLCCGRGYKSELVLHLVRCECRFKFCCKVVCSECPKQRLQHYCS